jgi:hypothetical protein
VEAMQGADLTVLLERSARTVRLLDEIKQRVELLTEPFIADPPPPPWENRNSNISNVLSAVPLSIRVKMSRFFNFYVAENDVVPFGGRSSEIRDLNSWLSRDAQQHYLIISAPAGRGKTALILEWMKELSSEWYIIFVPISIRFDTADDYSFYEALAAQLAKRADVTLAAPQWHTLEFLRTRCFELVHAAAEKCDKLIIIIDGLDEAQNWQIDRTLLRYAVDSGIRVAVSARALAGDQTGAEGWARRLDSGLQQTKKFDVVPLGVDEIADVLRKINFPIMTDVDLNRLARTLAKLSHGDPLLIRLYAGDLSTQEITIDELERRTPGYDRYFQEWFERQCGDWMSANSPTRQKTEAVLAILSVALGPLPHSHFEGLCGRLLGTRPFFLSAADMKPIQRFLIGDGLSAGYAFQHVLFARYFGESYFRQGNLVSVARAVMNAWCEETIEAINGGLLTPINAPPYVLIHGVQHLAHVNAELELIDQFLKEGWRRARTENDGGYARYSADVSTIMSILSKHKARFDEKRLTRYLRGGLILSSLRSIGAQVPIELLKSMIQNGRVSSRQVLHRLGGQSAYDLASALPILFDVADASTRAAIIDAAMGLDDEDLKVFALGELSRRLPESQRQEVLDRLLQECKSIAPDWPRLRVLGSLIRFLPSAARLDAFTDILALTKRIDHGGTAASALSSLPAPLPKNIVELVRSTANSLGDMRSKAALLGSLSSRCTGQLRVEVFGDALNMACQVEQTRSSRSDLLRNLFEHLPDGMETAFFKVVERLDDAPHHRIYLDAALRCTKQGDMEVLDRALNAYDHCKFDWFKLEAMATLAKCMSENRRAEVVNRIWGEAKATCDGEALIEAFIALSGIISSELRGQLLDASMEAIQTISEVTKKARMLIRLLPILPGRLDVLHLAEAAASQLVDKNEKYSAFVEISQHAESSRRLTLIKQAFRTIAIDPATGRAVHQLVMLARLVPEPLRTIAVYRALSITAKIDAMHERRYALKEIAEYLPPVLLSEALTSVERIGDELRQATVLVSLSRSASKPIQTTAVARAVLLVQKPGDSEDKVNAIRLLARYAPKVLLEQMLTATSNMPEGASKAFALQGISGRMGKKRGSRMLLTALESAETDGYFEFNIHFLVSLTDRLPISERTKFFERAFAKLRAEKADGGRTIRADRSFLGPLNDLHNLDKDMHSGIIEGALVYLAAHIPSSFVSRMLEAIEGFGDESRKANGLAALAPRLPHRLLRRALISAEEIRNVEARFNALSALYDSLKRRDDSVKWQAILEAIKVAIAAMGDGRQKAFALSWLSCQCGGTERRRIHNQALAQVNELAEHEDRAYALIRMAEIVPSTARLPLFTRALAEIDKMDHAYRKSMVISTLVERTPRSLLLPALKIVEEMSKEGQAEGAALLALSKRIPVSLLTRALDIAENVTSEAAKVDALILLMNRFPAPQRNHAVWRSASILPGLSRSGSLRLLSALPKTSPTLKRSSHDYLVASVSEVCRWWQ